MMQDNPQNKAKAAAMSAIMRNPNLSRIISDAWSAPPGSTANEKARNILRSLHTPNANYLGVMDGKGGPASDFSYNTGASPALTTLSQNLASGTQPEIPQQDEPSLPEIEMPKPTNYGIVRGVGSLLPSNSPLLGSGAITEDEKDKPKWWQAQAPSATELTISLDKTGRLSTPDLYSKQQTDEWADYMKQTYNLEEKSDTVAGALFTGQLPSQGALTGNLLIQGGLPEGVQMPSYKEWAPRALGYVDTKGNFNSYQLMDLIGKDPQAVDALQNWLGSNPNDNKTILDFMEPGSNFASLGNLILNYDPIEGEALKNEVYNVDHEWDQEEANKLYLELVNEKTNPDPNIWGEGITAKDITDEAIRDKVEELTGFAPPPFQGPVQGDASGKSPEDLQLLAEMAGNDALRTFMEGLDPSLQEYYSKAYENALSGRGREGFYRDVFSDSDLMEALGVPKEVIDRMPKSGILAEHLIDLKDSIKKDYNLQGMEKQLLEMQNQGVTIEDDMKAYIRGKDEYLAQTEKLIKDTETQMANMDTSNPYVAERMKNYLNYLNIIQGRTNQRYIDYLNDSYSVFQKREETLNNRYTDAFNRASEEYKDLAAVSTESYNSIKSQLDRVYDLVALETESYEQMDKNALERLMAVQNLKRVTLDNQMRQLEIDNYGLENLESPKWSDYDSMLMAEVDNDGVVNLEVKDPFEASLLARESNLNADTAVSRQLNWLKKYLKYQVSQGNMETPVKDAYAELNESYYDIQNNVTSLVESMEDLSEEEKKQMEEYYKSQADNIYYMGLGAIEGITKTALRDKLTSDISFPDNVRKAIQDLAGIGLFDTQEDDKAGFVSKYEEELGPEVSGILFDTYWRSREGGLEHDEVFVQGGKPIYEIQNNDAVINYITNLMFDNLLI